MRAAGWLRERHALCRAGRQSRRFTNRPLGRFFHIRRMGCLVALPRQL